MTAAQPVPIYISAGSNIEAEANLRLAARGLRRAFGPLQISPVYETAAVGFQGAPFLNCVFACHTTLAANDVVDILEALHVEAGRIRGPEPFSPRTLDLDLLLYGDAVIPERPVRVPRDDITAYAFVLKPLADLAPGLRHPVLGQTMAELWAEFPDADAPMIRKSLDLDS